VVLHPRLRKHPFAGRVVADGFVQQVLVRTLFLSVCSGLFGCVVSVDPPADQISGPVTEPCISSPHWGGNGELWDSRGPLKDFSLVGYREGTVPLPTNRADITYGPGRHVITNRVVLNEGQVLRGAGMDRTTLYFPKGLDGMGQLNQGRAGNWDWSGGVIWVEGSDAGVEGLTIEFPPHDYIHLGGTGFNGILFRKNIRNSWAHDVRILNYDTGISFSGSANCTVDTIELSPNVRGDGAHIDIHMTGATRNLATRITLLQGCSIHGLAGNWGGSTNVFSNAVALPGSTFSIDPDHNGPTARHFLYSNIQGETKFASWRGERQDDFRPETYYWNFGNTDLCPLDIHREQVDQRFLQRKGDGR